MADIMLLRKIQEAIHEIDMAVSQNNLDYLQVVDFQVDFPDIHGALGALEWVEQLIISGEVEDE